MRIKCSSIKTELANCSKNAESIINEIKQAWQEDVNILVFPELTITGYSCGDTFRNQTLLSEARKALQNIATATKDTYVLSVVGMPLMYNNNIYNVAVVLYAGDIIGIKYKTKLINNNFKNEERIFSSTISNDYPVVNLLGKNYSMNDILNIKLGNDDTITIGIVIGNEYNSNDLNFVSNMSSQKGASIILNPSFDVETVERSFERRDLISSISRMEHTLYVTCNGSEGESTTDIVSSNFKAIVENGKYVIDNEINDSSSIIADIDTSFIKNIHQNNSSEYDVFTELPYWSETKPELHLEREPFLRGRNLTKVCDKIVELQGKGLIQKMKAMKRDKIILGISGGLDSTVTLMSCVMIFKKYGLDMKNIIGISMPGPGTSKRTYDNSIKLMETLGITSKVIDIKEVIAMHLDHLEQPKDLFDLTYEQTQSRERTQILLDLANKENGIVIGTGCMSEFALGWMTYSGDHISMYALNVGLPKTMVKRLAKYFADVADKQLHDLELSHCLLDILDTPVSPELLPLKDNGDQDEKTEELVGQYVVQDFFLYHLLVNNFGIRKIFDLACQTFVEYDKKEIYNWLNIFTLRFFTRQYKKNCFSEGLQIFDYGLSPRGAYQMPGDLSNAIWKAEIDEIKKEIEG